jgi:APA family basic amino acid/polyamine antiporter
MMKKEKEQAATGDPDSQLVRVLGPRQLTANIFNYTVGSGIFVLPAFAVAQIGAAAPLAYLACAVVMALVVLIFAEAGSRVTVTGGPYAYVEIGLGPFFGFATGILLAVAGVAAAGAVAMLLAQTVARLFGLTGAWWPAIIVITFVGTLAAINIRGVAWGARVIEVFTVAKLVPLLFFVVVGAFFVTPSNLHWEALPTTGQVAATAGTLIFAFIGIEAALMPSGEVRNPTRTVPQAAIMALVAATLLYLAVQAVALGILGPALAEDNVAPLASATATFAGSTGALLLLAGASVSMFGWLTGAVLAGPRALFALSRDGFLPHKLTAVHPRFHTPWASIIAYGLSAIVISLTSTYEQLAVLSNLAALGVYFLGAVAVWRLRVRNVRTERPPFMMPGGLLVPILACTIIAWIISQTITLRELIALATVLAVSLAMYIVQRNRPRPGAA